MVVHYFIFSLSNCQALKIRSISVSVLWEQEISGGWRQEALLFCKVRPQGYDRQDPRSYLYLAAILEESLSFKRPFINPGPTQYWSYLTKFNDGAPDVGKLSIWGLNHSLHHTLKKKNKRSPELKLASELLLPAATDPLWPEFSNFLQNYQALFFNLNRVIIDKSCGEVALLEQDTIENVS